MIIAGLCTYNASSSNQSGIQCTCFQLICLLINNQYETNSCNDLLHGYNMYPLYRNHSKFTVYRPHGDYILLIVPHIKKQYALKTLDTIDNCYTPVFSLGVSQHMHEITNLLKFELNWLSKSRDNNGRKKHPQVSHKVVCFQMLDFEVSNLNLRSRNQIKGKLLLSRKLRYFRGSCFSQCFILSIAPHYSLPSKVLC